ncbi:MAG TPA: protein kinase [Blastocatellia bacterium]|nr:protein kinase [Blastocatellia bacterium]
MDLEMIAHYRILEKLGEGGMGEVYKAQDTKLERVVALKVLPESLVGDEDRVRRFIQEARAASALNHPNIITIHDIGEAQPGTLYTAEAASQHGFPGKPPEGQAPVHYIAMEYVEGSSLSEKIHNERTELKRLLDLLAQAAEGIAKAHSAGIVHRDLKPENIMVSDDGFVKILDFGIAKLVEPSRPAGDDLTEAPTALMEHTRAGVVMGTVGYMSPEQAQGKAVDTRSDIFSFGCILYEAATRHRPFKGDSLIDSLHKIVYSPAPPLKDFNPAAPAELQRIIRKCLAKNPDERYQSIRDVAIDLRDLIREYDSQPSVAATGAVTSLPTAFVKTGEEALTTPVKQAGRYWKRLALGVAALAIIAIAAIGLIRLLGQKTAPSLPPFQIRKITRLTSTGKVASAAISPDGRYVIHVLDEGGQQSLWMRQVATGSTVQIIAPSDHIYSGLTFSPDGNYIYYLSTTRGSRRNDLYQAPVLGGTPRKVLEDVDSAISLSPDGRRFAFRRDSPTSGESTITIASLDGGQETKLAVRKLPDFYISPAWSPDGKVIVSSAANLSDNLHMGYVEVNVETGAERLIGDRKWLNAGRLSWVSDGSSFIANAIDEASKKSQIWQFSYPSGEARRITNDLNDYRGVSLTADSGTMITVQGDVASAVYILPDASSDRAVQITAGASKYDGANGVAWTPDGRIVYSSRANENHDIWIMDPDGKNRRQLTSGPGINVQPAVSPDGRYIAYVSYGEGAQSIWRIGIDGTNAVRLTSSGIESFPTFSPDGKWVIYVSFTSGQNTLWRIPVEGGEPTQISEIFAAAPDVSPDGKLIACYYWDNQVGNPLQVAIIPFEGGQPIKLLDMQANSFQWTPDGSGLAYVDVRGGVSNIWVQPVEGGSPRQMTSFNTDQIFAFAWSRDGKQLACARGVINNDVVLISSRP